MTMSSAENTLIGFQLRGTESVFGVLSNLPGYETDFVLPAARRIVKRELPAIHIPCLQHQNLADSHSIPGHQLQYQLWSFILRVVLLVPHEKFDSMWGLDFGLPLLFKLWSRLPHDTSVPCQEDSSISRRTRKPDDSGTELSQTHPFFWDWMGNYLDIQKPIFDKDIVKAKLWVIRGRKATGPTSSPFATLPFS